MGKGGEGILAVTRATCEDQVRRGGPAHVCVCVCVECYFEWPLCCVLQISNRLSRATAIAL